MFCRILSVVNWQRTSSDSGYDFSIQFNLMDGQNSKHLMTGPEGNSEFCFPRISMFEIRGEKIIVQQGTSH